MTFVLKPQAPFDRLRLANSCPDLALRKAIIIQAIIDASHILGSERVATSAREWLFGNSKSFRESCMEADLDPEFVVRVARQIIEEHRQKNAKVQRFNKNKTGKVVRDLLMNVI